MDQRPDPLVSVVTPVYNTEKYLAECIESVLAQRYSNWEYTIVNNRSTDNSLKIAQDYAARDDRIRVCDNEQFLDQIPNWNHAIRQISPESKYCKVLHADDWLFPDCLRQMVDLAEAHPSVGVVGAYRLDEDRITLDGLPFPSTVVPGRQLCHDYFLGGPYVFGSPTSLLIRSALIRKRPNFYDETILHADKAVCFELLQDVDFGFVHQVLTFTRRHNESVTSRVRRLETRRLEHLLILHKFGPIFLKPQEFNRVWQNKLNNHYRLLARCLFERREKEFWDFQRAGLATIGQPIRLAKLSRALALQLTRPRETLQLLGKRRDVANRPSYP